MKIKTFGRDSFSLDKETVDVRYVEQLTDTELVNGLAHVVRYGLEQTAGSTKSLEQTIDQIYRTLDTRGWEPFCSSYVPCGLAKPRKQEIFAAFNRFRG